MNIDFNEAQYEVDEADRMDIIFSGVDF